MSLAQEQAAFLLDVCKLVPFATGLGFMVTGRELGRTAEQQAIYFKKGKTRTMQSNHLRSCAIDLYFIDGGNAVYDLTRLKPIGDFWESLNVKNSWGGNWTGFIDAPHFERRP